jgi:hypothetical protein
MYCNLANFRWNSPCWGREVTSPFSPRSGSVQLAAQRETAAGDFGGFPGGFQGSPLRSASGAAVPVSVVVGLYANALRYYRESLP